MGEMRYCENCGTPLVPGMRFCENCGKQITWNDQKRGQRRIPEAGENRKTGGMQPHESGWKAMPSAGNGRNQNLNGTSEGYRSQLANPYIRENGAQEYRERYRQERLEQDWEQSWERRTEPESGRGMTAAQYVLIVVIIVMLAAVLAMGAFWMVGRSGSDSSMERSNTSVSVTDKHSMDAVPAGEDTQTENPIVILTP